MLNLFRITLFLIGEPFLLEIVRVKLLRGTAPFRLWKGVRSIVLGLLLTENVVVVEFELFFLFVNVYFFKGAL